MGIIILFMKRKLHLFLLVLVTSITMFALAAPVNAQLFQGAKDEACRGASFSDADCDPDQLTAAEDGVGNVISTAIDILSILVGVAAVIMIIIGGFKYITSAGDPAGAKGAKDTILYAIIGLVVVAMAQVIVRFVLTRVNSGA